MILEGIANSFNLELLTALAGDVFRIALYRSVANLSRLTTAYTTDGEVIGSPGYEAGGQVLKGFKAVLVGDAAELSWTQDPLWPKSTITARGALIYNFSKQNRAVGVLDLGLDYSSTNGNFFVTLPKPIIRIGGVSA